MLTPLYLDRVPAGPRPALGVGWGTWLWYIIQCNVWTRLLPLFLLFYDASIDWWSFSPTQPPFMGCSGQLPVALRQVELWTTRWLTASWCSHATWEPALLAPLTLSQCNQDFITFKHWCVSLAKLSTFDKAAELLFRETKRAFQQSLIFWNRGLLCLWFIFHVYLIK